MKQLGGVTFNDMLFVNDNGKRVHGCTEVILLIAEPEYVINDEKKVDKVEKVQAIRFFAEPSALADMAKAMMAQAVAMRDIADMHNLAVKLAESDAEEQADAAAEQGKFEDDVDSGKREDAMLVARLDDNGNPVVEG